jgi:hypothetical protein
MAGMAAINRNKSWSSKGEEASHERKSPKKLVNVLFDSGGSCEIRFPVMCSTTSVHRVMIVSGDKSEMFLTIGLTQALLALSNSAFSNKCAFLIHKSEKQSITIDSCETSANLMGVEAI